MSEERAVDVALLQRFTPLAGMKNDNQASLARKIVVRRLDAGRQLFREGDAVKDTIWIVSGTVELHEDGRTVAMIEGGSRAAQAPLAPQSPRRCSARAVDPVEYLAIDTELLDVMITWDQTGTYEVSELQSQFQGIADDDWMTTLLQNRAFHRIPPANIQAIFLRMQRLTCKAGEVVIQQGTEGDYFYAIVTGRCLVTRETPLNREGIKLAQLGVGDTFGEESLISESKRNATVTMLTDGILMRLNKDDFRELLNEPLLRWVDYANARDIIDEGGQWLDVRLPSEHQNLAIEGSANIPLYFLRMKLSTLNKKVRYVVYCDTGRRSSAASYILQEHGYEAYVLREGLATVETGLHRVATA
jgi:CRP-like cAMP-binding protein/rhodanese-related sulfurtransferase